MKNVFYYDTVIGRIGIAEDGEGITDIFLEEENIDDMNVNETELIRKTASQLFEYFEGKRNEFSLPLTPKGTEIQKKVWKALCEIPLGETKSYKQVAEAIGNSKACRAVGMANNKNPIMIVIPCHRVVGSNGSLVGYAGGIHIKEKLLELEKNNYKSIYE